MKKADLKKYSDKANWKLSKEDYDMVCEVSGDLKSHGRAFTKKNFLAYFEEEDIGKLDFDEVYKEVLVRGILDGWVEDEVFGG